MPFYSIGDFAKKADLSPYTLRYYEKEQLLSPKRLENGRRYYTEQDIAWLLFIKRLKETGMPIKEIKQYALLRAEGDSTLQNRMQILQNHRQLVMSKMIQWQENPENLDQKINYYQIAIDQQP